MEILKNKKGKSLVVSFTIMSLIVLIFGIHFVSADAECTGQNCNINVSVTVGNAPPEILSIQSGIVYSGTAKQSDNITVSFTVSDTNTLADLNDSTAYCSGGKGSGGLINPRNSSICSVVAVNSTHQNYSCLVEFDFYDLAGSDWEWSCSVTDNYNETGNKNGTTFQISDLTYVDINTSSFGWNSITPGTVNQEATGPIIMINGGNQVLNSASVIAQNSTFDVNEISATNFLLNNISGSAVGGLTMLENSSVSINSIFELSIGESAQENIYAYLTMPSVLPGTYTSEEEWIISISS